MENLLSDSDMRNLVNELKQGKELARQLQCHLARSPSQEHAEYLLREILNSFDHSLSVINHGGDEAPPLTGGADVVSGSPQSLTGSLRSDDSDQEFKDQSYTTDQVSGKRKGVEKWTKKIEVCPTAGIDKQLDDGYGWRKYGQKNILGAKYPRGYYRCTYRYVKGCLATKQIQRSNDDPNIYEITYRVHHNCDTFGNSSSPNPQIPRNDLQSEEKQISSQQNLHKSQTQQEPFIDIQTSLRVISSQDPYTNKDPSSDPFHFPSSSILDLENNHVLSNDDDEFFANYLSNFPISSSVLNNNHAGLFHNLHTTESELDRVVSATTSANKSTTLGHVDFPFGTLSEFGSSFDFENERSFP